MWEVQFAFEWLLDRVLGLTLSYTSVYGHKMGLGHYIKTSFFFFLQGIRPLGVCRFYGLVNQVCIQSKCSVYALIKAFHCVGLTNDELDMISNNSRSRVRILACHTYPQVKTCIDPILDLLKS